MTATLQEALAQGVEANRALLARFLPGFNEANRTSQGMDLPNHLCWTLGHLALYLHEVAHRLDGGPDRPEDCFVRGVGASGDARRFDTESVCFGSTPVDDPDRYPTLKRSIEIFDGALARLAAAVRAATDDQLEALTPWGGADIPMRTLVLRQTFHIGAHVGQITDLRRALGLRRVLG